MFTGRAIDELTAMSLQELAEEGRRMSVLGFLLAYLVGTANGVIWPVLLFWLL